MRARAASPALALAILALGACGRGSAAQALSAPMTRMPRLEASPGVRLGIDVLEAGNFIVVRGKRLGLLTNPAGVDRNGASTVEILRRAPGVKLVALFATEHGIYGTVSAGRVFPDQVDSRSGLIVHSLYNGRSHKPTRAQLQGIDALVVDLQDIGVRSYTFAGAMKEAMEGCFENNVEVIVLDRPNPLGGLKVDGPMLDRQWVGENLVNEFPVPYVHGLTIGELAQMAKRTPGLLRISEAARANGRLVVVPMGGWTRSMRWPETGLTWVPTSPYVPDFSAVVGYPMTGLGCYLGGFQHGVGNRYPFRGISHKTAKLEVVERELRALRLPGLEFRRVSVPNAHNGRPALGLYVEVVDWDEWQPTELSFEMMRLACKLEPRNPFASASMGVADGFMRVMGSTAFYRDLCARGALVDVDAYVRRWAAEDAAFRERSRRFWMYR
jgi:uncharacterized protein YbbC (DUF1343 family)